MSLIQTFPSGKSENGGHTIINADDIAMPAQDKLKFGGDFETTDNDEDGQTEVVPHELTNADMQEIMSTLPGTTARGIKYSTEEQVIGEWIDGKPLYQKTIQIPVSAFSSTTGSSGYYSVSVFHNILNLGITVDIYGQAYGNVVRPVPFSYGADNPDTSFFASAGINNTSVFIECGTKFRKSIIDANTYGAYITVQYTKTTD